jgi:integrase
LIALHTGARLNEIFQLTVDDIKTINGVDCVEIHEAGKGNNLKTKASARLVPLHPRLRALGLFDYVEAVKVLPNTNKRLFPWLTLYVGQGYGDVPSQRFTELLKDLNLWVPRRKVFNSFRHTVQTALQTAGVDLVVRKHFIGHEVEDITVNVYGEQTPLKILADGCLPALNFDCIEWKAIELDHNAIHAELNRLCKLKKKPI